MNGRVRIPEYMLDDLRTLIAESHSRCDRTLELVLTLRDTLASIEARIAASCALLAEAQALLTLLPADSAQIGTRPSHE